MLGRSSFSSRSPLSSWSSLSSWSPLSRSHWGAHNVKIASASNFSLALHTIGEISRKNWYKCLHQYLLSRNFWTHTEITRQNRKHVNIDKKMKSLFGWTAKVDDTSAQAHKPAWWRKGCSIGGVINSYSPPPLNSIFPFSRLMTMESMDTMMWEWLCLNYPINPIL